MQPVAISHLADAHIGDAAKHQALSLYAGDLRRRADELLAEARAAEAAAHQIRAPRERSTAVRVLGDEAAVDALVYAQRAAPAAISVREAARGLLHHLMVGGVVLAEVTDPDAA